MFYVSSATTSTARISPFGSSITSYSPSNMAGSSFFGQKNLPDHLSDSEFGMVHRGRRKRRMGTFGDILESLSSALSSYGLCFGVLLGGSIGIYWTVI